MDRIKINNSYIEILEGDITEMDTDAIVNAANDRLIMGGGVAGAILKKGGNIIQEECNRIGGTYVGGAVITTGGNPRMGEGDEDNKLKMATLNSLKLADENHLKSIAFPAISTGIFGFPIDRCADIMLKTTIQYLKEGSSIEKVVFCLYGKRSFDTFKNALEKLKKEIDE